MGYQQNDRHDLPDDVFLIMRSTIRFLRYAAAKIGEANLEYERDGWALDFDFVADDLDCVLGEYDLPSNFQMPWIDAGETEAEAIERKLLKKD